MEELDQTFFDRVAQGYEALAAAEPQRVKTLDATGEVQQLSGAIWALVKPLLR
jgi:thymidylate kinase